MLFKTVAQLRWAGETIILVFTEFTETADRQTDTFEVLLLSHFSHKMTI